LPEQKKPDNKNLFTKTQTISFIKLSTAIVSLQTQDSSCFYLCFWKTNGSLRTTRPGPEETVAVITLFFGLGYKKNHDRLP
jgi:hypothetical protein